MGGIDPNRVVGNGTPDELDDIDADDIDLDDIDLDDIDLYDGGVDGMAGNLDLDGLYGNLDPDVSLSNPNVDDQDNAVGVI